MLLPELQLKRLLLCLLVIQSVNRIVEKVVIEFSRNKFLTGQETQKLDFVMIQI